MSNYLYDLYLKPDTFSVCLATEGGLMCRTDLHEDDMKEIFKR